MDFRKCEGCSMGPWDCGCDRGPMTFREVQELTQITVPPPPSVKWPADHSRAWAVTYQGGPDEQLIRPDQVFGSVLYYSAETLNDGASAILLKQRSEGFPFWVFQRIKVSGKPRFVSLGFAHVLDFPEENGTKFWRFRLQCQQTMAVCGHQ